MRVLVSHPSRRLVHMFDAEVGRVGDVDDAGVLLQRLIGDAAGRLDAAAELLRLCDRIHAEVVDLIANAEADPNQSVGLGVESALRLLAGRTGGDAKLLAAAADRLRFMPTVAGLLRDGVMSWPAVRSIVAITRHLSREQLAWVDDAVAAHGPEWRGWDADSQVAAVAELADRARPDLVKGREARRVERSFLSLQPGLDGSLALYGEFDSERGAAILERLDAPGAGETEIGRDPADPEGRAQTKGARQAERLHQACAHRCDSDDDHADAGERLGADDSASGRSDTQVGVARPSMLVLTPIERLAEDVCSSSTAAFAQLLWRSGRGPVRLSDAAVQRLACDATLRQVFTDGARVLGVGPRQKQIPDTVRAALHVRDGGCRFPGCTAPVSWTDGHHIVPRGRQGPTVLENLVLLCRRHHRAVHEGGWRLTLDLDDASVTVRRGRHTFTSRAHAERALRAPPPPKRRRHGRAGRWPDRADPPRRETEHETNPDSTCPF